MRKFELTTMQGHRYFVHDNFGIERTDMKFGPSEHWTLVGINGVHTNFWVPRSTLEAWLGTNPILLYKNGKAKYTVRDFDHGSVRVWGDGIRSIRLVD